MSRVGKGPGLLIVEGDADTLRREGHTRLTDRLVKAVEPQVEQGLLRLKRQSIRSAKDLEAAKFLAQFSTYDAAMILAHGGPFGVQAASDVTMTWAEVAHAIAPTKPRYLLAVACFGALSSATDALFDGIPSLERIVSSPAPLTINQAQIAVMELLFAAYGAHLPAELGYMVNALNAASTKGLLYTRTRDGRDTSTSSDRAIEDLLGVGLWAVLQSGFRDDDGELAPRIGG
ncbi:MAG: hypothetical protein K8H88_06110 [Sandaracinaceae bacterium]|nr:hypothetical protein [Sandaracinaceae bacterium]